MIRELLMVGSLVVVVTTYVFVELEIRKWHQRRREKAPTKGAT